MLRLAILIAIVLMTGISFGQDWIESNGIEYNCAIIRSLLANYQNEPLTKLGGVEGSVGDYFERLFPACPDDIRVAEDDIDTMSRDGDAPGDAPAGMYAFDSTSEGLQPVIGPLTLPAGVYVFTATTDGYMAVIPKSLAGDCGLDLITAIFNLSIDQGSDGAQSIVGVEKDCDILLEISNTTESWTLEIISAHSLPVETIRSGFTVSSGEMGLRPVLGTLTLRMGVYVFTATTYGYMAVIPRSLAGDCGLDLITAIFNFSSNQGADGAQSVVEVEKDCDILLEISNTTESWMLEIAKQS